MSTITQTIRGLFAGDDTDGGGPVQAVWNGRVIAESERTAFIEGNHYFPPEDVNREYLEPSPRHSVCLWKGQASNAGHSNAPGSPGTSCG